MVLINRVHGLDQCARGLDRRTRLLFRQLSSFCGLRAAPHPPTERPRGAGGRVRRSAHRPHLAHPHPRFLLTPRGHAPRWPGLRHATGRRPIRRLGPPPRLLLWGRGAVPRSRRGPEVRVPYTCKCKCKCAMPWWDDHDHGGVSSCHGAAPCHVPCRCRPVPCYHVVLLCGSVVAWWRGAAAPWRGADERGWGGGRGTTRLPSGVLLPVPACDRVGSCAASRDLVR